MTGWQSVYGYTGGEELFLQIWATQPQHVGLMAHLLQQGAVLSTSFQPFEVHLPYLLHFLDSFGLGGMRDLVVDPARIALRGEVPEQALQNFPWHPSWASKLGGSARDRLLSSRGSKRPWWCDRDASEFRQVPSDLALSFPAFPRSIGAWRVTHVRPKSIHRRATTCEVPALTILCR